MSPLLPFHKQPAEGNLILTHGLCGTPAPPRASETETSFGLQVQKPKDTGGRAEGTGILSQRLSAGNSHLRNF